MKTPTCVPVPSETWEIMPEVFFSFFIKKGITVHAGTELEWQSSSGVIKGCTVD
jgi:hypothetical protein